ncbi:MAG: NAD(P)-dependent oxidoreductase [Methanoregula sp.]|jgi:nucleoside-diphosphate-sugar epimerase
MKTVMLTGASGFIGRHCIPLLIKQGYEVHAITSGKNPKSDRRVLWHSVNLLEPDQVRNAIESICPTHLLHFAWYTKPGLYWSAQENIQWMQASLNLVQEFSEGGGKRIVGAGTCAEYDWRFGYCSEDITPLKPQTLYGISKHSLQIIAQEILMNAHISNAWGRIFFLYGPFENQSRLVPSIINALLQGRSSPCTTGDQIRDYLYVEDVAEAFVRLLDSPVTGPVNIGSGKPVVIREIIGLIGKKIGREELIRYGQLPTPSSEAPFIVADNRRLLNEVGWTQHNDLDKGLDRTISWWKQLSIRE